MAFFTKPLSDLLEELGVGEPKSDETGLAEIERRIEDLERLGDMHMQRMKLAGVLLTDLKRRGDDLKEQEDLLHKKTAALSERELRICRLETIVRQREAAALEIAELDKYDLARGSALSIERRSLIVDRVRLNKIITAHRKKRRSSKRKVKKHPILTHIPPEHAFRLYTSIWLPVEISRTPLKLSYFDYGTIQTPTSFIHVVYTNEALKKSKILASLAGDAYHPLNAKDVLFTFSEWFDSSNNGHLFIASKGVSSSSEITQTLREDCSSLSIAYISAQIIESALRDVASKTVLITGLCETFLESNKIVKIFSIAGDIEGIAFINDFVVVKYSSVTEALECLTIFSGNFPGSDEEPHMHIATIPIPTPIHIPLTVPFLKRPAESERSYGVSRYLKFSNLPFSVFNKPVPRDVEDFNVQFAMKHQLLEACPDFRWSWQSTNDTDNSKKPLNEYAIVDLKTPYAAMVALSSVQLSGRAYITFVDEKIASCTDTLDILTGAWIIREREGSLRKVLPALKFKGKSGPEPFWAEIRNSHVIYSPEFGNIGVYDQLTDAVLMFMYHRLYKGIIVRRQQLTLDGNQSSHVLGNSVEIHVVSANTDNPTKEVMGMLYTSAEIAALTSTVDLPVAQNPTAVDILCTGSWEIFETEPTLRPGEYMFVSHNVLTNVLTRIYEDETCEEIGNYVPAIGQVRFTFKGKQRVGEVVWACQSLNSHIAGSDSNVADDPKYADMETFRVTDIRCLEEDFELNVVIVEHQSYYTANYAMDIPPAAQRDTLLKLSQTLSNSRKRKSRAPPLTPHEVPSQHEGNPYRHQLVNLLAVASNKDAVDWWTIRKKEKRRRRPITFYTDKVTRYGISGTTLPAGELITGNAQQGKVTLTFKHNKLQTVVILDCSSDKWKSTTKPDIILGIIRENGRSSSCVMEKLADEIELEKVFLETSDTDSEDISDCIEEDEEEEEYEEDEEEEYTDDDSDFESDIHIPTVDWITVSASSTQPKVAKHFMQQLPPL